MKFVAVPRHSPLSLYTKFEGHINLINNFGLGKVVAYTTR